MRCASLSIVAANTYARQVSHALVSHAVRASAVRTSALRTSRSVAAERAATRPVHSARMLSIHDAWTGTHMAVSLGTPNDSLSTHAYRWDS